MKVAVGRPDEVRRVGVALLGVTGGVVFGTALGTAWGGGILVLVVVAVAVGALLAAASRPLLGVAVVPLAVGFGNDPLPGAPGGLQVVHALVGLALGAVGLHLMLADGHRLARPDRRTITTMLAVAGFALASVLSGLVGRTPYLSMEMNLVLIGAVLLAGATVLVTTSVDALRALLCVVVAASVAATSPVLGQLDGVSASWGGAVVDNRPTGAFVDPNELGAYGVVALVLALTLLATPGSRWWEIAIGSVGAIFALVALVLSFSRGSWIAGSVAIGALLCVSSLRPRLLRAMGALAMVGTLLFMTGLVSLPVDTISDRAASLVSGTANPYDVRPYIWNVAVQGFVDSPLLGAGPGSFPRVASDSTGTLWAYPVVHAHNGALTVAAENGVVGLLAAAAVVVLVTRGLLRVTRRVAGRDPRLTGTAAGLLAALVGVGASLVVDYTLRNPLVLVTVWLVVGMAVAASRLGEETHEDPETAEVRARVGALT